MGDGALCTLVDWFKNLSNGDSSLEEALDAECKRQQASEDWRGDIKPRLAASYSSR